MTNFHGFVMIVLGKICNKTKPLFLQLCRSLLLDDSFSQTSGWGLGVLPSGKVLFIIARL